MLKRLIIIGVLTGIGQLFSLFIIKWIAGNASVEEITQLALTDSLFQLLLNGIALGLQSAAMRNIATSDDWQKEYSVAQSARFTLSLFVVPLCTAAFYNQPYLVFALAPLVALSGDYALYSLGQPVKGASVALFRIVVPYFAAAMAAKFHGAAISLYFLIGVAIAYLASDIYIANTLKVRFVYRPVFGRIVLYIKTLPLGLVNLSFYFIGLGVLLAAPYFYNDSVVTVAFVGLKFYVIIKGILRIMHQAFIKEMLNDEVCLRIDQLSMLVSGANFMAFFLFPASTIQLLFGRQFEASRPFFIILAVAMLFYSFVHSMATRTMLEKKDRNYTILAVTSATSTLLSVVILSFIAPRVESIAWSILIGEIVFCAGLIALTKGITLLAPRLLFLGQCAIAAVPFAFLRFLTSDTILVNLASIACFLLILLFLHRKRFKSLT